MLFLLVGCGDRSPRPGTFATPIQHVVILFKENHSFENYFAGFPGADAPLTARLSDGGTTPLLDAPEGPLPRDLPHFYSQAVTAFRDGGMDGFDRIPVAANDAGISLPFVHYPEARIPAYWTYAREFVLCDHFFTTTLSCSFPSYLALWTAQSPAYGNPAPASCQSNNCPTLESAGCRSPPGTWVATYDQDTGATGRSFPCFDLPTMVDAFGPELSWLDYAPMTSEGSASPLLALQHLSNSAPGLALHARNLADLLPDLDRGVLPNLLVANVSVGPLSEHPPQDPCRGERFTVEVVNRLMRSPEWAHTAIVIAWDDWGGFYDNVAPPVERLPNGRFFTPGFRVPAIVISPYAKRGYVLHQTTEQASIPALVEDLFHLPRLAERDPHARDDRAGSLLDAFDFHQPPRPPVLLTPRACP